MIQFFLTLVKNNQKELKNTALFIEIRNKRSLKTPLVANITLKTLVALNAIRITTDAMRFGYWLVLFLGL
ncbi:hypothetical protein KVL49_00060 [Helicobacter pylori]|nr:hypothetical protein KVL49_00060 [Helicobacter pylori]